MALVSIPTSADIYIEVNGTKVAAAQSYRVKSARAGMWRRLEAANRLVRWAVECSTGLNCPVSACVRRKGWIFMS